MSACQVSLILWLSLTIYDMKGGVKAIRHQIVDQSPLTNCWETDAAESQHLLETPYKFKNSDSNEPYIL